MLLVFGALLIVVGGLAVACSSDTDDLEDRIAVLEHQAGESADIAALQQQVRHANMVATLNLLDDVGFHHLNETIAEEEIAPAGTVGSIRTALRAVAVTDWPDDLAADAGGLQTKLDSFLDSLLADETGEPLTDASLVAHDGYHDFTDLGWTYLADQAGLDASSGDDHEADMGMDEDMDADMDMGTATDDQPAP